MKILNELLDSIENYQVKQVCIGSFTTAVISKNCGLSSTLSDKCGADDIKPVQGSGYLHEKDIKELSSYVLSNNLIEASVGMAAINSAMDLKKFEFAKINASKIIEDKGKNKIVAVIGHFPFVKKLKRIVKKLMVFEQRLRPGDIPSSKIPDLLPEADIIAISATTLINHTFEDIMKNCKKNVLVIMLGPSTPLSEIMFDYNVDILCGSYVYDIDLALRHIQQGTPFRFIEGKEMICIRK